MPLNWKKAATLTNGAVIYRNLLDLKALRIERKGCAKVVVRDNANMAVRIAARGN